MSKLLAAVTPPSPHDFELSPAAAGIRGLAPGLLGELYNSSLTSQDGPIGESEETLILDSRAELTPAQMVERKLIGLLRDKALPVSQLQMTHHAMQRRG